MRSLFIKPRRKKASLAKDYFYLSAGVMFMVSIISAWLSWSSYRSILQEREFMYQSESDRIAFSLEYSMGLVENFCKLIGTKIVEHPDPSPEVIADILTNKIFTNKLREDLFTLSLYKFIDADGYVVATNLQGRLEKRVRKNVQDAFLEAKKQPWKLLVAEPRLGSFSDEPILPAGMGITDANGKFLGYLSIQFNRFKLTHKILKAISTSKVSFIVLTDDLNVALSSPDNDLLPQTFFKDKLNFIKNDETFGTLSKPVILDSVTYHYYQISHKYPFIVLVGSNNALMHTEFIREVIPLIVQTLALALFFLALLIFFRRHIVTPISRLARAAEQIAQYGESSIPRLSSHEMQMISISLLFVIKYIRRNKRAEHDLAVAKRLAEHASAAKSEFLINMSHELRTPLNAIIGFSEIILSGLYGKLGEKNKEYTHDIHQSGLHLLQLISDLLDLSKAESGKFDIRDANCDLGKIITRTVRLIVARAEKKGVSITMNIQEDLAFLRCDQLRIKQGILNIITNAVKYTEFGGQIAIFAYQHSYDNRIVLEIEDTGIGIDNLEIALSEFGTIDNSINRTVESTGLGLPLAKKLFELHNASFSIQSIPSKGTKVVIVFPPERIVERPNEHLRVKQIA